jgi:hypothetical protein
MKAVLEEIELLTNGFNVSEKALKRAMSRAINETLRSFQASATKEASKDIGIHAKLFRERTFLIKASVAKVEGGLSTVITSIPGILFNARQSQIGVHLDGDRIYKSAFITAVKRGPLTMRVYRRKYLDRESNEHHGYPIEEIRIPIEEETQKAYMWAASQFDDKLFSSFLRHLKLSIRIL